MINWPKPEKNVIKKNQNFSHFFFLFLFLDIYVFNCKAIFFFVWQSPAYIGNIFE